MMQPSPSVNSLDNIKRFFQHTQNAQHEFEQHLSKALVLIAGHLNAIKDENVIWRLRNKILQLRLDQRDVLLVLMRLQHNLCMALGLDPKSSEHHNLERLMLRVGDENSKHQIFSLAYLSKKIAESYPNKEQRIVPKPSKKIEDDDEENDDTEADSQENIIACEQEFNQIAESSAYFQYSLEQLNEVLRCNESLPPFGVIYTYVATLQGPVSRFHMAIQSGLGHLDSLLKKFDFLLSNTMQETLEIQPLLLQTIQTLEEVYYLIKQPLLIPSSRPELSVVPSEEELERQRQIQRTMRFF